MERLTANGRFEDVFIGAKEGLERLWLEQMPFPFLVAGCVLFLVSVWMDGGGEGEGNRLSFALWGPNAPTTHTTGLTPSKQPTNQNRTRTIQTTNQPKRVTQIQTTNHKYTSNEPGSSRPRTGCGCWRSSCS